MSIESDSPISTPRSPQSPSSDKENEPVRRETSLAKSVLPKEPVETEEPKVRVRVRPIDTKEPIHEKVTTAVSSMTPRARAPLPPLNPDAGIEEIKQYLIAWVQSDPKNHSIATAKQILTFLASLSGKAPHTSIRFEEDTCELPDIFHAKLFVDHLQGITVCSSQVKRLPESLGCLTNLLALRLRGCTGLTKLPKQLAHLNRLTIVGIGDCSGLVKLPKALLNKVMGDGQTLMTRAVIEGGLESAAALGRLGCDLNAPASDGKTPVMYAIAQNNPEMLSYLIQALHANPNQSGGNGQTPLTYAIIQENSDMVELLLALKADINLAGSDGDTPLTTAIIQGNTEMVAWLCSLKADVHQITPGGLTPLAAAVANNQIDSVKELHRHGAKVNSYTAFGDTPLIIAINEDNPEMVTLLCRLGAHVNLPGGDGLTPMARAIFFHLPHLVQFLREKGADEEEAIWAVKTKLLSHAWGVAGTSETDRIRISLEGLFVQYSLHMLETYATRFFASPDFLLDERINQALSKADQLKIQKCIGGALPLTSKTPEQIIALLRSKEPFMMLGDYKGQTPGSLGHAISLVLHDDRLFICNRGEGKAEDEDAVRAFSLPVSSLTSETIEKLTNTDQTVKEFYEMIESLALQPAAGDYNQQTQKVANCAWANGKGALGILFHLLAGTENGYRIYKKFTEFARKESFKEYLQLEYHQDAELIQRVRAKGVSKGILAA